MRGEAVAGLGKIGEGLEREGLHRASTAQLGGRGGIGGAGESVLSDAEHFAVAGLVVLGGDEIVERLFRDADDVALDDLGALARAVFRMLQAALPFEHRPAGEIVGRQPGEDGAEIDLAVFERAEPSGPIDPCLKAAIDALADGLDLGPRSPFYRQKETARRPKDPCRRPRPQRGGATPSLHRMHFTRPS